MVFLTDSDFKKLQEGKIHLSYPISSKPTTIKRKAIFLENLPSPSLKSKKISVRANILESLKKPVIIVKKKIIKHKTLPELPKSIVCKNGRILNPVTGRCNKRKVKLVTTKDKTKNNEDKLTAILAKLSK